MRRFRKIGALVLAGCMFITTNISVVAENQIVELEPNSEESSEETVVIEEEEEFITDKISDDSIEDTVTETKEISVEDIVIEPELEDIQLEKVDERLERYYPMLDHTPDREEMGLDISFDTSGMGTFSLEPETAGVSTENYDLYVKDAEKVFNVLDYGADPNDGKDDTQAIQRASYAANDYQGKSTIYIPSGKYNISIVGGYDQAIELYNNTDLIMEADTILELEANAKSGYKILMVHGSDNIRIIGGSIIGDKLIHQGSDGEFGHCLAIYDGYNIEVDNVSLGLGWGDGIYMANDCNYRAGCDNVIIRNCHIYENRRNNISIVRADNITIDNCLIENACGTEPQAGIDIEPLANGVEHYFYNVCHNITLKDTTINVVQQDVYHYALFSCWGWDQVSSDNLKILNCDLNGVVLNGATTNCTVMDTNITGTFYVYKDTKICEEVKRNCPLIDVRNQGSATIVDHSYVYEEQCDSHSLTLNDELGLNFYMSFAKETLEEPDTYVHLQSETGKTVDIALSEAQKSENGQYVFSMNVPAPEMATKITAQLVIPARRNRPEVLGTAHEYSVKEYGQSVLSDSNSNPQLVELVKAMLNYGGYAQTYFGYAVNNLANKNVMNGSSLYSVSQDPVKSGAPSISAVQTGTMNNQDLTFYGSSLVCDCQTYLKLYFKSSANLQNIVNGSTIEIKLNGMERECEVAIENGMYVVYLYDIAPAELGKSFSYKITTPGSTPLVFTYSPMIYVANAQKSTNTDLVNLSRALYYYNQAALNYFK